MLVKSQVLESKTVSDIKKLFEEDLCESVKCLTEAEIGDLTEADYKNGLVGVILKCKNMFIKFVYI